MRRSKRRRPRVAWMPVFGGSVAEATTGAFPGIESEIQLSTLEPNGAVFFDAAALTFDVTESATDAQADPTKRSLRDIVSGNEWRLRRIVGKAFISAATATVGSAAQSLVDVALGFIVCKTYDDGTPWTDFSEVNPLSQDSMEDPWIWRRRWILNPHGVPNAATPITGNIQNTAGWFGFPQTTAGYGSVMDGPHIDSKVNRVIHRSERLFAVLAARKWNPSIGTIVEVADSTVRMLLDYRLLGSLRSQSYGNRGNMSR